MIGLSLNEFCCMFCCPPCPSSIAAKLAFLPPTPSYSLVQDVSTSRLSIKFSMALEWNNITHTNEFLEPFYVRTKRQNRIVCIYIRCTLNPAYTILFSHGNAVDIGQMSTFLIGLGSRLNCNILGYDYSGYGVSSGKPSEKNLYSDAEAAWNALRNLYNASPEKVILYGQSIGTVPTIDLASKQGFAGVILHSPLISGMNVACPQSNVSRCCDVFHSTDKINKIKSVTLIIHGTNDDIIDISHGINIFDRLQRPVEPLWVQGAGHNDIELHPKYFERIKKFITEEVPINAFIP